MSEKGLARNMGRMCCGGRCMTVEENRESRDTMFIDAFNFENWNCMVNWFFLHIEEDKDVIFHHQTCMARDPNTPNAPIEVPFSGKGFHNPKIGPITTISECDKYMEWLRENGPVQITCPKTHCGCGICVPKSANPERFKEIKSKFVSE